jgi:hypothetical protein
MYDEFPWLFAHKHTNISFVDAQRMALRYIEEKITVLH